MPLRRFFSSARDKRTLLYCLSLLLDILCLFAGYIVALQLRGEQWLAAGGHSIIYIALPIFIMFEIAREGQAVETLANRLTSIQRSLGEIGRAHVSTPVTNAHIVCRFLPAENTTALQRQRH